MTEDTVQEVRTYADNGALQVVFGPGSENMEHLEGRLGVSLPTRGNEVTLVGTADGVAVAARALDALYARARAGQDVSKADVDAAVRMGLEPDALSGPAPVLRTRKRVIEARSPGQARYLNALARNELVFGLGPAGTGKTYLAIAHAVMLKMTGVVDRLILSRPAVEAGERLGFLPGDLREKVDPYLRPMYDALYEMLPGDEVMRRLEAAEIEVAPLAFMRGRTLANACIILDEAQNTTPTQMKMFLTRMGEHSRMVVTGDMTQIDLPLGARSGLRDALETLEGMEGVAVCHFTHRDVVRHDLVTRIVRAYEARDRQRASKTPAAAESAPSPAQTGRETRR
ncbi:PhoH family protein [Roseospira goensis]|uniref:PhoH-like protein n=1 Tax=Roseospira goensis TaxID=391922 RepID=A0A7W6WJC5_9PROT|nr:phosphate starvation-inducible PhoH-like protein [Roseospira goensis]